MTNSSEISEIKVTKTDDYLYAIASKIGRGEAGGNYIYCIEEDKFYIYEEGYWQPIHKLELLGRVSRHVRILHLTINMRKNIIENLKMVKYERLSRFNCINGLNLKNFMVRPLLSSHEPHNPDHFSTIRLNYNYDISAKCDLWIKTLNQIFENDQKKINLFQEFLGYCLTDDINQKKSLLLLGDSNSGKSTLLFTLRALLGEQNCSSVPLEFLGNPQYTPMMVNKLVNIDADVNNRAGNYESQFKIITSGEPVNCNQKFIAAFTFIPKCKIILAANEFPKITDHSSAFYKRLILIPCDRIFEEKEQIKNLRHLLEEELPGILNWAIEGLKKLKARGIFEQYDFMKDAIEELENENNPTNVFFEEHIEIEFDSYVEKGDLFNKYKLWCEKNKTYNLSAGIFSKCVFKKYHKHTPRTTSLPGSGKRIWRNIKYVDFKGQHRGELIDYQT